MIVELQPAYVLHTRPYRDTSMLVDLLTPQFGRITAVARGVRSRKTPKRNILNPFTQLLISFQGKSGLKLLTHFETESVHFSLAGNYLYSGFYLNELLMRLLPELDPHEEIFQSYKRRIQKLNNQQELEPILRAFELHLLTNLGYAIHFGADAKSGSNIVEGNFYCLDVQRGFYLADANTQGNFFSGAHLLAIDCQDFTQAEVRLTAKRITRILLKPLLGSKPLMSRELFS